MRSCAYGEGTPPQAVRRAPAAASIAVGSALAAPPRAAQVLGAFPAAWYLGLDPPASDGLGVVAVVTAHAVRLPNALVLGPGVALPRPGQGDGVRVGGNGVVLPGLEVTVGRWWDPRPRLPSADPAELVARTAALADLLEDRPPAVDVPTPVGTSAWVGAAGEQTAAGDRRDAAALAERLVGLGPGLTPSGDDVLAGALATLRLLGAADEADALAGEVAARAGRTTALSAALLACAARGQVARPAAEVLRALVGAVPLEPAVAALLRVGHTSGRDLAAGVLLGVRLVLGAGRDRA